MKLTNPRHAFMAEAVARSRLNPNARGVLLFLVTASGLDASIEVGLGLIGAVLGMEGRHVSRAIAELVDAGIVRVIASGGGRGNRARYGFKTTHGGNLSGWETFPRRAAKHSHAGDTTKRDNGCTIPAAADGAPDDERKIILLGGERRLLL